MKLYRLGKGVYKTYRETVKGNQNIAQRQAQRKLTRNIILAFKVSKSNDENLKHRYFYGNLHILVVGNKIVWIKNVKQNGKWFYKDQKKYDELNVLLGIEDDS